MRNSRIPWEFVFVFLASLTLVGSLVSRVTIGIGNPATISLLRSSLFAAAIVIIFSVVAAGRPSDQRSVWHGSNLRLLACVCAGAGIAAVFPVRFGIFGAGLIVAALEEVVFRWKMPRILRADFGLSPIPATLLSQIAFAACHYDVVGRSVLLSSPYRFWQLCAAGVFLCVVVRTGGIVFAIALHSAMNGLITTGWMGFFSPPSYIQVILLVVGSLCLLVAAEASLSTMLGRGMSTKSLCMNGVSESHPGFS